MELTWNEVLAATNAKVHSGKLGGNAAIPKITTDTRKIETGDLFIALRGENFDGAEFAADALQKGASAVLVGAPLSKSVEKALKNAKGAVLTVSDTLAA